MDSTNHSDKNFSFKLANNNEDIAMAFVEVDNQLAELASDYGNIGKVKVLITIHQIRNKLFQLYNICVFGLNVRRFASHKPGDRTPLNGGCAS